MLLRVLSLRVSRLEMKSNIKVADTTASPDENCVIEYFFNTKSRERNFDKNFGCFFFFLKIIFALGKNQQLCVYILTISHSIGFHALDFPLRDDRLAIISSIVNIQRDCIS